MSQFTPEFWAIVVVGALIWWALTDGIRRLEKGLTDIEGALSEIHAYAELAPWVPNQPEPDISELAGRTKP